MVRGKPVKHWENRFAFDYAFAGNSIRPFHRASRSKQKQISAFYLLFIFRSLCSHLETRLSAIPSFSALKWTKRWEKKTAHTFTQNTQQNFNCYSNRYPDGYLDVWDGFSNDPVNTINWRSWSDDIQKRASVWAFFFFVLLLKSGMKIKSIISSIFNFNLYVGWIDQSVLINRIQHTFHCKMIWFLSMEM